MSTLEPDVVEALAREPTRFLSALAWHISVRARASYPAAGISPEAAIDALTSFNELIVVILEQLRSLNGPEPAYPDSVLLLVLKEKAKTSGRSYDLERSLQKAIDDLHR